MFFDELGQHDTYDLHIVKLFSMIYSECSVNFSFVAGRTLTSHQQFSVSYYGR